MIKNYITSLKSIHRTCSLNTQKRFFQFPIKHINMFMDSNGLTEEQKTIQESAYNFAKNEFYPHAKEWDEKKIFPKDVYKKAAELGFAAIYVNEKFGGSALGRLEASLIFEGLATGCVGSSAYISIHNMCCWMIDEYGNEEQKEKWLPAMSSLDMFASYCLTEPNSGSDAMSLKTSAVSDGDDFIINGTKQFISGDSDIFLVMCRTAEKEISCIAVERKEAFGKGLSFGKNESKMGWNVQPTQMVIFENLRVPKRNIIGKLGQGFKIAMSGLDGGRINIASCSLGGAAFCLETAKEYIKQRKQFGKSLSEFQYLQFKIADMATDLQASRSLTRLAAISIDNKSPDKTVYSAMAKNFATDKCFHIVSDALQLHGGYGYLKEYPIERYFRDLRVHMILEGTNEIMKMIISRNILNN
jgi:alkylation response protein AidB-like acyl-CoA dehydrogenase